MNRSVASLAISTLLKTCNEDSVQKLLKQISHYLPDLGLDFKIETIQSTALLYHRLPQKADVLLKFLTDCLKEEGNVQFRESVVDTIIEICPSQREVALMILAEHIEDCEHAHLQTKIINFLAEEGPKSKNPASYIRFIYNRVNLEKAVIRAAAISALAAFGHKVSSLRKSIMILLQKCLTDSDDEVRERALFYLNLLKQKGDSSFLGPDGDLTVEEAPQGALEKDEIRQFIFDSQNAIDIDALQAYVLQQKD
jgi:coatomer protein complex subunit gamma